MHRISNFFNETVCINPKILIEILVQFRNVLRNKLEIGVKREKGELTALFSLCLQLLGRQMVVRRCFDTWPLPTVILFHAWPLICAPLVYLKPAPGDKLSPLRKLYIADRDIRWTLNYASHLRHCGKSKLQLHFLWKS